MSCTDAPVRPLTDFPELLRLAADLLTDPPARPRTLQSVADCGVVPGSDAELLLAQLVFHAPDGPDMSNDALTRAGLAFGLNRLADAPSHPPALLGSLRLAGIEPNGTLLESCTLAVQALLTARAGIEDAQAKTAMFRRRTERLMAWFALPPDQRHPMGPELTPDLEPEQTDPLDKHLWDALSADLSGRPLSALIAHSLDRATRKFGRWVRTPEDVHKLVGVAIDDAALVARAFAELRRRGYAGIVSFADPVPRTTVGGEVIFPGHIGRIYQASNAVFTGRASPRTKRLLPDGRVFDERAWSKIRARHTGWRYAVDQLVAAGAVPPMRTATAADLCTWLKAELPRCTRPFRHRGNYRYLFGLHPAVRHKLQQVAQPYPKFTMPR